MMDVVLSLGLPIAVLVAIIAVILYGVFAVTRRRRDFPEVDAGIGTVRRLYFYIVALVALVMAANGVTQLGRFVLEATFGGTGLTAAGDVTRLAVGLSLTMVGIPLWFFHWRAIQRQVSELPVEVRSVIRKVYIYLILAVSVGSVIAGSVSLFRWLLGRDSFSGYSLSAIVVWGGLWVFHWSVESQEGQPTPETRAVRRVYLYLVSAGTLIVATVGLALLIDMILGGRQVYESRSPVSILERSGFWSPTTQQGLALLLAGTPVWVAHWVFFASHDYESALRQLYLYVFAILGGIATVMVALGVIVYHLLTAVGADDLASDHFEFLPSALSSILVGGGVLFYHAYVANREAGEPPTQSHRARSSFHYLLAFVGLATLSAGVVVLGDAFTALLTGSGRALVGSNIERDGISVSVTLFILGMPLWIYYWLKVQRRISVPGSGERSSPARRQYIFAVLGTGMLALLGSVSFFFFVLFRELLDGDLSAVFVEGRTGVAVTVAATIFVPYHWMAYRTDRLALRGVEEEGPSQRKVVTVLASQVAMVGVRDLEAALGYRVELLHWADIDTAPPEITGDEIGEIVRRIGDAAGPNVILVPQPSTYSVFSYR